MNNSWGKFCIRVFGCFWSILSGIGDKCFYRDGFYSGWIGGGILWCNCFCWNFGCGWCCDVDRNLDCFVVRCCGVIS